MSVFSQRTEAHNRRLAKALDYVNSTFKEIQETAAIPEEAPVNSRITRCRELIEEAGYPTRWIRIDAADAPNRVLKKIVILPMGTMEPIILLFDDGTYVYLQVEAYHEPYHGGTEARPTVWESPDALNSYMAELLERQTGISPKEIIGGNDEQ